MTRRRRALATSALALTTAIAAASTATAQQPVTLEEAVAAALGLSPDIAAARADSGVARGELRSAREWPNPDLSLDYTKDSPTNHAIIEQPIEYPWVRAPRIRGAKAGSEAASLRLEVERTRVRYDVTRVYAEAAAARRIAALSAREAAEGDRLVRVTQQRREAGDASDLDVDLARVNAGRLRSDFLTDSLRALTGTLELQSLMGLPVDSIRIAAVDTLVLPLPPTGGGEPAAHPAAPDTARSPAGAPVAAPSTPLALAAATAERSAAAARLSALRRGRLPAPAVRLGVEGGEPDEPGLLPAVGVSIPLPVFNRNGGAIASARSEADRADAQLAGARRDATLAVAKAEHGRDLALARLEADGSALSSAERVARLSVAAYEEGAYPLASVLEAQRAARDAQRRVLEDAAALRTADAALALARVAGVRP